MATSCNDWSFEKKPGGGWAYNEDALGYNDATFAGFVVYYNALGEATTWTFEPICENDVEVIVAFQDGTEVSFQDGTIIEYN